MRSKTNKILIDGDISYIYFNNKNEYTIIDTKNLEKIKGLCFFEDNKGYALCKINYKKVFLHHIIIGKPKDKGIVVDHINQNPLDNRESNLRFATRKINSLNSKIYKNNTTGIRGVYFVKETGKYRARIKRNNTQIHIGIYNSLEEAKSELEKYKTNVLKEPCEFRKYI